MAAYVGNGDFSTEGCISDTVNKAKFVRDLYEKVDDTIGTKTVGSLCPCKSGCHHHTVCQERLKVAELQELLSFSVHSLVSCQH